VGLEVNRCLCIIDAGNVFISTAMGFISALFVAFHSQNKKRFIGMEREVGGREGGGGYNSDE
jgi:hypothetical protein